MSRLRVSVLAERLLKFKSLLFLLGLTVTHGVIAQPASIEGDKVIIPTLNFDSVYYTLHLQILPNTGNEYFSVPFAEVNNSPVLENASSLNFGHTINVPHLSYEGQSYAVEFVVTSQNPLTLKLNGVNLNPSTPGSGGSSGSNTVDLGNLLSSAAITEVNLHSFADSLSGSVWRPLRDYAGFQSMVEIIVGEPCSTSDAAHFRLEAASRNEIILDDQGRANLSMSDFDKVDVFYSEAGRPLTSRGNYCPPMSSTNWTTMKDFIVYDSRERIVELDFTTPPDEFDKYHAANHGGLIYEYYTADQLRSTGLNTSTRYTTQKVTDLNLQITVDDSGTYYKDGLAAQNDDSGTAAVSVSYIDYDGSEVTVAGNVESSPGKSRAWTPLLPPGPGLTGCWEEADKDDAWCFFSNGTGQFIQDSINGNPGTLYITFGFEANVASGALTYKNNHVRLVGSCCDKAETLNENTLTESFSLNRNVFRIGGIDYIYTAKNLAY